MSYISNISSLAKPSVKRVPELLYVSPQLCFGIVCEQILRELMRTKPLNLALLFILGLTRSFHAFIQHC